MPFYDYRCAACGKTTEMALRLGEVTNPTLRVICPGCLQTDAREVPMERQYTHRFAIWGTRVRP